MSRSKYKIPRMSDGTHMTFSRSRFLNGDAGVYFGPGQPPCCWPGYGCILFDDPGFDATAAYNSTGAYGSPVAVDYRPPTAWPAAGTLLRMPQVVNLSLYFTYRGSFYTEGGDNPDYHGWEGDPHDLFNAEYERILGLYNDAKSAIESVRAGRTFVNVVEWQRIYIGPLNSDRIVYPDFRRGVQVLAAVAPPADVPSYVGTDFLHIYMGHYARDSSEGGRTDHLFVEYDPADPQDVAAAQDKLDSETSGDAYLNSVANVSNAHSNFAGYRTMLYSSSIAVLVGAADDPLLWNGHLIDTFHDSRVAVGDDFIGSAIFDQLATDLADKGVTHDGKASDITSSDQIVQMIADHFGFDPDTGADLLG